jgi:hypothetical protein
MAFREVRVYELREVLRLWLDGEGFRSIERLSGVDRKTVRRYVTAAQGIGLDRESDVDQLNDVFIGSVVEVVRGPSGPSPPGVRRQPMRPRFRPGAQGREIGHR